MIQRNIGHGAEMDLVWEEFEHTNQVSARWVFQREVARRHRLALGVAATDAGKFDALVGFGSNAYEHVVQTAAGVVDAYMANLILRQKRMDPYVVGPVLVQPDGVTNFQHSVHEGYSGLNGLELTFAKALDTHAMPWCRNPSQSGYGIPLITVGKTRNFYPDFLVWVDENVFAIDTTGPHLLGEKTGRKLLSIHPPRNMSGRLVIRFVSPGHYRSDLGFVDDDGYTVWGLKQDGSIRATRVEDVEQAIDKALNV